MNAEKLTASAIQRPS